MDRRTFTMKGLALAPAASLLLAAAGTDARKQSSKRRPTARPTPPRPPIVLTRTFSNRARIRLDDNARANPYPSIIKINGLTGASVLDINLVLHDLSHGRPVDVAVMLVSPTGRGVAVMYEAGGTTPVNGVVLTINDQAAVSMPYSPLETLRTGTYKPSIHDNPVDIFPSPAPQRPGFALADFYGENLNGEWQLFIFDDAAQMTGELATGWSLEITYQRAAPIPPKPKRPKKRRRRKNRKIRR